MKKASAAAIAIALAVNLHPIRAQAGYIDVKGCTADEKIASLSIFVADEFLETREGFAEKIMDTFQVSTMAMYSQELVAEDGLKGFLNRFKPEERDALLIENPVMISRGTREACEGREKEYIPEYE